MKTKIEVMLDAKSEYRLALLDAQLEINRALDLLDNTTNLTSPRIYETPLNTCRELIAFRGRLASAVLSAQSESKEKR